MPDEDTKELRLQKVEEAVADLRVQQAAQDERTTYIKEGFDRISEKIDRAVSPLVEQLRENTQHLEAQGERIGEHGRTLEDLGRERRARLARGERLKKAMVGVFVGAAAIGLQQLFSLLLHLLHH